MTPVCGGGATGLAPALAVPSLSSQWRICACTNLGALGNVSNTVETMVLYQLITIENRD